MMFLSGNSFKMIKRLVCASAVSMAFIGSVQAAPETVAIGPSGEAINLYYQVGQAISANGSFAIFAGKLEGGTGTPLWGRDRQKHTTQLLSKTLGGQAADSYTIGGISADGRYVVFESANENIVSGDTNQWRDIFVLDRTSGLTKRANVANDGTQAEQGSGSRIGGISADGRYVAFTSNSRNLLQGNTADNSDGVNTFVRDMVAGTTKRINLTTQNTGGTGSWGMTAVFPKISADGRFVAFSDARTLAANGQGFYVRDQLSNTTTALPAQIKPWADWSMSSNGRYLAYYSTGTDDNVYVYDRQANSFDQLTNGGESTNAKQTSLSANGRYVTYMAKEAYPYPIVYDRQTQKRADLRQYGLTAGYAATLSDDGRHILAGTVAIANPLFADDGFCSIYNPYVSQ